MSKYRVQTKAFDKPEAETLMEGIEESRFREEIFELVEVDEE